MSQTIESQIAALDHELEEAERHAKSTLGRIRALRKRASSGDIAGLAAQLEQVPAAAEQVATAAKAARGLLTYDTGTALADGSYLAELMAEAHAQSVTLIERDGRLTAFPLLLKLEPRAGAIRIGRKLERRLRPAVVVKLLGKAQAAARFDAKGFVNQLFRAYTYLAPLAQPGWKPASGGHGPVVALDDVFELMTMHPAAAAEQTREGFACDLLRLDRAPDTQTSSGHRFSLPASTGSKGRNRLTVFDERGEERIYVGLRFTRDTAGGGGGA